MKYERKLIVAASWILTALCFIVVNIKEGSVLAQTDILQYVMKAIIFLTLMISMVLGASGFASEREQNTLESLLLTPVPVKTLAGAKYLGILLIGIALYLVSMPYLFVIEIGSGATVNAIIITALTGVLLELAFVAISLVLSIIMQSTKGAILMAVEPFLIVHTLGHSVIIQFLPKHFSGVID